MKITFDPAKRAITLKERGLDFVDAAKVFAGPHITREDTRRRYAERRFITAGYLDGRFVVAVWTPRGEDTHMISLRYGHGKEEKRWQK